MVQTADLERRRLERNLHDGAQQRLVGLALALRLAEDRVERDPQGAARSALEGPHRARRSARRAARARPRDPPRRAQRPRIARRAAGARLALPDRAPTSRATSGGWTKPSRSRPTSRSRKRSPTSPSTRRPRAPTSRRPCATAGSRSPSSTTVSEERIRSAARACRDFSTGSRALGGTLTITSPPGAGTRLEVRLPVGQLPIA